MRPIVPSGEQSGVMLTGEISSMCAGSPMAIATPSRSEHFAFVEMSTTISVGAKQDQIGSVRIRKRRSKRLQDTLRDVADTRFVVITGTNTGVGKTWVSCAL